MTLDSLMTRWREDGRSKLGPTPNTKKTKVMKIHSKTGKPIIIHDKTVEEVKVFTYLGHHQWDRGQNRINKASAMFNTLGKIWSLKYIPVNTKICIFNSDMENNKTPQKTGCKRS